MLSMKGMKSKSTNNNNIIWAELMLCALQTLCKNKLKNPQTKTHNNWNLIKKCDKCPNARMRDCSTDQTPGQHFALSELLSGWF